MITATSARADSTTLPRGRTILYWAATVFVAGNSAVAGTLDVLRLQPLIGILLHLGYPAYFSTLLGAWKLLGVVALLAPRFPRVKEWAYAGFFIEYTAALTSHLAVGDPALQLIGPLASIGFLVASWALRPSSRRV